ncbi:MAG: helix-turn-helix domain-containing protein [Clostridia bacterium]|nr:helix-turn-helix domain-containing protein [Clostridia bacterium]
MEIKIIQDYILYLIKECGLSVTLHPMNDESLITGSTLMSFNIHDNPYCSYIKSLPNGHLHCLAQQKKVFKRCCKENESFSGVCYAGVKEYCYPLHDGKNVIGFVSISSYAYDKKDLFISSVAKCFDCSLDSIVEEYSKLKTNMPDKSKIDTLIFPLCKMLELAYLKEVKETKTETLNEKICRYIQRHYFIDLTTDLICKKFSCSKSHFSHSFKSYTGKNFREYLTDIRLNYAKQLLEYSNLNVTQIAFSVGFNDSNYFSNLFKQKIGVSPLLYRKSKKHNSGIR